MRIVKYRKSFVIDRIADRVNEKVTEVKEIEKFSNGINKEVTILDKTSITLQEVAKLIIVFLKEQGYEESEV